MKIHRPALSIALFLVATAGFAADPPAAGTAAAPQAPATASAAQQAAAATPAAAPKTAAATDDAAAIAKSAHELGYAPKQRSGKTVYCKSEAEIGSHLSSMKCFTPEEMVAVVHRSTQNQESVSKMQRTELYEESRH